MEGGRAPDSGIAESPPVSSSIDTQISQPSSAGLETNALQGTVDVLRAKVAQEAGVKENTSQVLGEKKVAIEEPKRDQATDTETQAREVKVPKVPRKLAGDPEYIRILGERYSEVKRQGTQISKEQISQITESSLSEYYNNQAKTQIEKGLPEEIKKDPLYHQKLGE